MYQSISWPPYLSRQSPGCSKCRRRTSTRERGRAASAWSYVRAAVLACWPIPTSAVARSRNSAARRPAAVDRHAARAGSARTRAACASTQPRRGDARSAAEPFDVPGHRAVQPGAGRFCRPACWAAWRWEHEPETFPQSELRGAERSCRMCGKIRYRPPSHKHLDCCSEECAHEAFRRWLASPTGARWRAGVWIKLRHGDVASVKAFGRLASVIASADDKRPGAPALEREEPELAGRVRELLAKGRRPREIVRIVNAEIASGQLAPRTSKRCDRGISRDHVRGIITRADKVGGKPPPARLTGWGITPSDARRPGVRSPGREHRRRERYAVELRPSARPARSPTRRDRR